MKDSWANERIWTRFRKLGDKPIPNSLLFTLGARILLLKYHTGSPLPYLFVLDGP
jgi:hypothetical protein